MLVQRHKEARYTVGTGNEESIKRALGGERRNWANIGGCGDLRRGSAHDFAPT